LTLKKLQKKAFCLFCCIYTLIPLVNCCYIRIFSIYKSRK